MPNRLAAEQSPYLLQHAANPVDWWPWCEEAFTEARRSDRPIFLSVGYATCHWCHVMEHESFEDAATAALLNRHFVPVKVDREERPDVDRVYMTFVQATTGAGGWPMSVWLTPDLQPFYGGTYFPPASQYGRPAFGDVLTEIARAWREERESILSSASQIVSRLALLAAGEGSSGEADASVLDATRRQFEQAFDRRRGGFGDAPKFPRPSELLFLLREHARSGEALPRDIVLQTLRAMAMGGMRDHVGGGFHRYSVDGSWRVPHFEKMLYDQAQLVLAYLEGAQVSGDPFFAQIAEDTLQYVARDLTDADGAFLSAEDADSVPPEQAGVAGTRKLEGAFYLWTIEEVRQLLGESSRVFELRYGLLPNGNAPFDPQHEFEGKNILYTARPIADISRETGMEPGAVATALLKARVTLYKARTERPRPALDDKVLTGWNGLMVAAMARAARVLDGAEASPAGGDSRGLVHPARALGSGPAGAAAPISRGAGRHRCVRGRLRVSHMGAARAVPGVRRCRLAGMGVDTAGTAGCALPRRARRVVLHRRPRSAFAGASEGRVRRRRACGDVGVGLEHAGAVAPHGRRPLARAGPRRDCQLRRPPADAGAGRTSHGCRTGDLAHSGGADRGRRPA
jgi:uncharacterized protein